MGKICMAAIGTRGDVFPVLALVNFLKSGGVKEIKVVSSPDNSRPFRQAGIDFFAVGDDFSKVVKAGNLNYYREQIGIQFEACLDVYAEADVIVGTGLFYAGRTLAEYFKKKYRHIFYTPQVLKSDLYSPAGTKRPFRGRMHNRLLWMKSSVENNFILKKTINEKRGKLGLDPIRDVYGYFIDRPDTVIAADDKLAGIPAGYSEYVKQIDFLYLDGKESLGERLEAFLEKGAKPVLISFGSAEYAVKDFKKLLKATIDSVRELGHRAVVLSKTETEEYRTDDEVLFCEYAPHYRLLPKVSAIIHHGGIGTVYGVLKSGTPQIIVPQAMDQHFWAEIVKRKGLGKAVYPDKKQYSRNLKNAISEVFSDAGMKNNIDGMKDWLNGDLYREESLKKLQKALPELFSG